MARAIGRISIWLSGLLLLVPATALGVDRVYWANKIANEISFANLDGSDAGDLVTIGATVNGPSGVAIDPTAGRIYWANSAGSVPISYASLDGSDAGDLNTGAATVNGPNGVAIDPAGGRVYWANFFADKISVAKLDGSGGTDLDTGPATVDGPSGVAVDPTAGRIYWANFGGVESISFAKLDGSGGGNLNTGAATVNGPIGVSVDPPAGRIYWANGFGNKISFAKLDGSGGGDLPTGVATVDGPSGVAVDPAAGRIYWANVFGNKISFANFDGSAAGDLATIGATANDSRFPALLHSPRPAGAPAVSGGSTIGSVLTCAAGAWAANLVASFLFRAPASFAYGWTRDGAAVPGATSSQLVAAAAGEYRCAETAANAAGSGVQESAPHTVTTPPDEEPPPDTELDLRIEGKKLKLDRKRNVKVKLACPVSEESGPCETKVALKTLKKFPLARKRKRVVLAKLKKFKPIPAGATRKVGLRLSKRNARLVRKKKAARKIEVIATGRDQAANRAKVAKKMKLVPEGGGKRAK